VSTLIADLAETRRELIVRRARLMVGDAVPKVVFEGAFAAYVAALRGETKAGRWDPRAVDAVARQIARTCAADANDDELDELRAAHHVVSGGLSDPDITQMDAAPVGSDPFGVVFSDAEVFEAPRPTLVFAMQDLGKSALTDAGPEPLRALLRLRSGTAEAARAVRAAIDDALGTGTGLRAVESAPDEVIVGSEREPQKGALDLLQLSSAALGEQPVEVREAVFAALVDVEDGDDDLVEAAVRARDASGRAGLVAVSDRVAALLADVAAWVPGTRNLVDPATISRSDRWEQSALLSRPPVIGREEDLDALSETLGDAAKNDGATLVHVHGPAGIGKRALLRAGLARLGYDDERAPVLFGAVPRARRLSRASRDQLGSPPYGPVGAMIRALAGAPAGAGQARARLARLVLGLCGYLDDNDRDELAGLEDVLAYLVGIAADDERARVDGLSPRSLQVAVRRAFLLVVRALSARGNRTPLLILSGAHALDPPTRDLLAFLARHLERVVVVALTPGRWRVPRQLGDLKLVRRELRPLDATSARGVLSEMLGDVEGDDLGRLAGRGRGSPLALIHLARSAIESGQLRHDDGVWTLDLAGAAFPAKLDRLLRSRVDRLPEGERRVLGCCAVLGPAFLADAVRHVARHIGVARADVDRALARLSEIGFLGPSRPRPGAPAFPDPALPHPEMYSFEHPLLADAAASALDDDERDAAHAAAADALESLLGGDVRSIAVNLARHLLRSGSERRALPYLRDAARRSLRLDAPGLALAAAQRALDVAPPDERFPFLLELERAHGVIGAHDAQLEALKSLVEVAERGDDLTQRGRAYLRLARFHIFHGDAELSERAVGRALPPLREADDARGLAEGCRVLALCRFERRDLHGAIDALNAAAGHSPKTDVRGHAVVQHQLGAFTLEAGDAAGALAHLMRARDFRRAAGDPAGEAACLDAAADAFARRGRLPTAMQILARATALRVRIGDDAGRASGLRNLAEVALSGGDAARARELALEARDLARQLSLERLERLATIIAARAHLLEGDAKGAERLLDNLRRRVDVDTDPFATMEASLYSARAKRQRAARARTKAARERLLRTALERAKQATRIGERHGYATGQVLGMATTGEVLLAQGDPPGALLYAQRAAELAHERPSTALPVEIAHLAHARALESLGDVEEAQLALDRALEALDRRAAALDEEWRARFWSVGARRDVREMSDRLQAEG
jgi:tetratricopeptide (TPR) repeat protein